MKVRTITVGIELQSSDFIEENGVCPISVKLATAKRLLDSIKSSLTASEYEVQTLRVALNSPDEWLLSDTERDTEQHTECSRSRDITSTTAVVQLLVFHLTNNSIDFCSLGCCSTLRSISLIPSLLAISDRLYCSALFRKTDADNIAPDLSLIRQASKVLLEVSKTSGMFGCFRYCASFNCNGGTPFFPAAFYEANSSASIESDDKLKVKGFLVSIGLECADLLFMGFHGAESVSEGSRNLAEVMKQAISPIQTIVSTACTALQVTYGGIDASINPGLSIPDSVGAGLENLLFFPQKATSSLLPLPAQQFGEFGTLAAVLAVTSAVKSLSTNGIKLIGYNGLMLPVMEDLILAQRAAQSPPTYTLRDLLIFSSVCGVGLDTVPVPGDITEETVSSIFMETAALAFRLNKPLSCRLLLMESKQSGDLTTISHPYICNTRVFSV